MERSNYIILILFSVVLVLTNTWKFFPVSDVSWIYYKPEIIQPMQIFIFDTTEMLKMTLLYGVITLLLKNKLMIKIAYTMLFYSVIRIVDYYLYFNSNDFTITILFLIDITIYAIYTTRIKKNG